MRIINLCKEREQIHNYDISWHSWGLLHRCLLENSDLSLPYYYSRWIKGLSGQEFNCGEEDNILYRTLSQIPIYLVTHDQCKKTYEIDLFGHIEGVTVPEDKYGHFDNDETGIFDLLGVYISSKIPNNPPTQFHELTPRIFIWVDKIWKECEGDWHKYQILLTKVILHELMHGMMDVNLLGYAARHIHPQLKLRNDEESIANAIPLTLLKDLITPDDWKFLANFVYEQPSPYKEGLDLAKKGVQDVSKALRELMNKKMK